jgi:hypothetical protein
MMERAVAYLPKRVIVTMIQRAPVVTFAVLFEPSLLLPRRLSCSSVLALAVLHARVLILAVMLT